jgi:histidyl-tRNA synthetase
MVHFFQNVGLTSQDVGIKINSRMVIAEVLTSLGVPEDKFAATCVLVDKLEKVSLDEIQDDLEKLGLTRHVVEQLTSVLTNKSINSIATALPPSSEAIIQLRKLWSLVEAYGISEWVIFDASVVRGLAYYTGIVYEAFDRKGELRAIAGGGRYDRLLETFGGDPTPAVGFGFGDAVIIELLKEREILPSFESSGIDTVVFAMDESLYPQVIEIATILRTGGQSVDVILDTSKKTKWVFKYANRIGVENVVIVGKDEWTNGEVSIKFLSEGTQISMKIPELKDWAASTARSKA